MISRMPMSHDAARALVCAVCTNEWGEKAIRKVKEKEEDQIRNLIPDYSSIDPKFPSGICKKCVFDLRSMEQGKKVDLLLPEDYTCTVPRETRATANLVCTCRWCYLGRLSGPSFLQWQRSKKARGVERQKVVRLCPSCYLGVVEGKTHTCQASTMEVVENLVEVLPEEVTAKLAHNYLARQVDSGGDQQNVLLPPSAGGHPLPVTLGHQEGLQPSMEQLTHQDVLRMRAQAGISSNQMKTILADLRAKLGRGLVEPGIREASSLHNSQYSEFFTAKMEEFKDKDGHVVQKPFIFCSKYPEFLAKVEENRGVRRNRRKLGGDSGKGFYKLAVTVYDDDASQEEKVKKARRSREQGITGGEMEVTGQSMILLLAAVPGIPETSYNIWVVLQAVGVNSLSYKITGDLKFLMPCFGLMSCSSLHPCLFCTSRRQKGKWEEGKMVLRTMGRLQEKYEAWVAAGSRYTTAFTSRYESTVGPVLVKSQGDTPDTMVLSKVGMPSVHLLLAVNDILRPHMVNFFGGEEDLMELLRVEVGVVPHSYQGAEGAFEGPQCSKILDRLAVLEPHLQDTEGILFFNLLSSFAKVKKEVFGARLGEDWEATMATFTEDLNLAHLCVGLPITPKLHIIQQHVAQVVRETGRGLGRENEAAVEALHSTFQKVWALYTVKDEASPFYLQQLLRAVLRTNADNTRHS